MDPIVVSAMLIASFLHAAWHALVKSSGDRVVALAGMNLVSGSAALSVLPVAGLIPGQVIPAICGSVLLHVGYKIALARLYGSADLGRAYPLARGVTPLLSAAMAFALLGDRPSSATAIGLVLVSTGVILLAAQGGMGIHRGRLAIAALAAGSAVAAYSVVDAYGVRVTGNWFTFTAWLVAADSTAFVAYALATRGRECLAQWRRGWLRVLCSGLLGTVSFCVFMWALGRAPVAAVAALRETSVVFAALIGIAFLKERASVSRMVAATAVACGVGLIGASR